MKGVIGVQSLNVSLDQFSQSVIETFRLYYEYLTTFKFQINNCQKLFLFPVAYQRIRKPFQKQD